MFYLFSQNMFDFTTAYNNFKKLKTAEKIKKLLWILKTLQSTLTTYDDMYLYIKNTPNIEDQTLINYYEIILNDLIKMEEISTQKEYKDTLRKLLVEIGAKKDEEKDQKTADTLLKNM